MSAAVGQRIGGDPADDNHHFMPCGACGQELDMRDLEQVAHHEETDHGPYHNPRRLCAASLLLRETLADRAPFRFRDERGLRLSITRHRTKEPRMTRDEIAAKTRKLIAEHMDADPAKVTDQAAFIDDLGADSLDWIELIMAAEEEFDIEIADDEAEDVKAVGQAIDLISRKLSVTA